MLLAPNGEFELWDQLLGRAVFGLGLAQLQSRGVSGLCAAPKIRGIAPTAWDARRWRLRIDSGPMAFTEVAGGKL